MRAKPGGATLVAVLIMTALQALRLSAQELPDALAAFESSRASFITGHVRWSLQCNRKDSFYHIPRQLISRFASEEYILEDWGDPEGVVRRTAGGEPDPHYGHRPHKQLVYDGKLWEHVERRLVAGVVAGRTGIFDARVFGVAPALGWSGPVDGLIRGRLAGESFKARRVDALVEVTRSSRDGRRTTRWLLDPDRDWIALRVTRLVEGKVTQEARITPRKFGEVWFPASIHFFSARHEGGTEPIYVVEVASATFNRPDHPRRLRPEDIGIQVGTNIDIYDVSNPAKPVATQGWDGEKLVPLKQLFQRIAAGELKEGADVKLEGDRLLALSLDLESFESRWERYTRDFIRKYKLTREQAQRAYAILDDCRQRADVRRKRIWPEVERIRKAIVELDDRSSRKKHNRQAEIEKHKEQMVKLRQPIWKLFREQLVPRLDRLPTRAQHAGAEGDRTAKDKP